VSRQWDRTLFEDDGTCQQMPGWLEHEDNVGTTRIGSADCEHCHIAGERKSASSHIVRTSSPASKLLEMMVVFNTPLTITRVTINTVTVRHSGKVRYEDNSKHGSPSIIPHSRR